jgi:hypothetical protein
MPSPRSRIITRFAVVALALTVVPGLAAAQRAADVPGSDLSLLARVAGGFLGTLLIGGLLLVVAPRFTERVVRRTMEEMAESFIWGIGVLALFLGVFVLLFVTVIGIPFAVLLLFGFVVVALAGNAIGYIGLLMGVTEAEWIALLVGAAAAGVLAAIPVLGDLISFVIGSLGTGAIVREWRLG